MTAEVDSETRKYLHELDSFGRPPEIFDIHSEAAIFANSKPPIHENPNFRQKLHQINVKHQKRISDELDSVKTVSIETRQPRTYRTEMLKLGEKAEIKKDEVENLRQSVLKANRPLNPWVDAQKLSPSPRLVRSPLNVQTPDQLSNGRNSLSPISPISNSATSSSSNASLGSVKWARTDGTYSAKLVNSEPKNEKVIIRTYRPNSNVSSSTITSMNNRPISRNNEPIHLRSGSLFVDPPSPKISKCFVNGFNNEKPKSIQETVTREIRLSDEVDAKNFEHLTNSFEKLGNPSKIIGKCGKCYETVFDNNQVTYAMDSIFHEQCLMCFICKQPLRNKKFYRSDGKNYCEEDYFLNNSTKKLIRCDVCNDKIADMVLQALGKSYHPRCFCCCHCGQCLDGVPFAVDGNNRVFCMEDYQNLFSPNCAVCHKSIRASNDFGQIVRVVAMEKEFHIDCYRCEGCGLQLTNERDKQCYPLNGHLLCRRCNIEWSRMADLPITDC